MPDQKSNKNKTAALSRRSFSRGLAGTALGIGFLSGLPTASADEAPKEWDDFVKVQTYTENQINHGSVVRLWSSIYDPDNSRWFHEFFFTNHGVGTEMNDTSTKRDTINSSAMSVIEADDDLSVSVGATKDWNAMWPGDSGWNDWGKEVTAALSTVATITGNGVLAGTLTATQIADVLLGVGEETGNYIYEQEVGYSGIDECAQHLYIGVNESFCCSLSQSMTIRSDIGISRIEWDIGFTEGEVGAGTSSLSGSGNDLANLENKKRDGEWGDPREMSSSARERFGIHKLTRNDIPKDVRDKNIDSQNTPINIDKEGKEIQITGKAVERIKEDGHVYIADNPPVEATATKTRLD